ncbi:hypothetical protein BCR15_10650 [Tessaracoccus lapidicaptus]|uniref:Sugar-binding domain-containing protein n=1 Tax=Tessaracoccus lapidicaptus TaxID=1427523 RepID=A0A1C0AGW3_9ACTN|nr:sugar-binding domain-containing protein [Tessaracoccus lapidicaptus]OCL30914.1 hypothetical protein BCR15_10650 [Tessaracoccus lapidicaptus]
MSNDDEAELVDQHSLMVNVARAYYLDDLTKIQVGQALGISRFRVARLLDLARELGVVTISINENPQPEDTLATTLRYRLGLRECLVIPTGDAASSRRQVAAAAAGFLANRIAPHDVLGLSWGRTLAAMTEYLVDLPPVRVVQLTGSVGTDLAISPIEILRRAALRSGGEAFPIMAPLVTDSAEAARMMREQSQIRRALDLFAELTIAMLSVGSWNPATSQLRAQLDEETQAQLEAAGVEGEVAGIFVTRSGEVLDVPPLRRLIGISAEELRIVPRIIVAAEGAAKAGTVIGAVRAGLANSLILDVALASEMVSILDRE